MTASSVSNMSLASCVLGSWQKVQATLKAYADGEYDFCLDADTIADITCLSDADTRRLVAILSHNKSGM